MHIYSDIAHFRAPYKNVAIHGFGATTAPATVAATTEPGVTLSNINEVSEVGSDGIRRYKAGWRPTIMGMLAAYRYIFITNTQVKLTPFTAAELAAAEQDPSAGALLASMRADRWVEQKVAEGYAVMVPFSFLFASAEALASETGLQIGATPATDRGAMLAASQFPTADAPMGAYLAEPGMAIPKPSMAVKPSEAGITPLLWAAGVIVVLGAGAYAWSRRGRGRVSGRGV